MTFSLPSTSCLLKLPNNVSFRVNEEYIEEFRDKSEIENTKNNTEWWKNVFQKWANEINLQANLEESARPMASNNDCRSF